MKKNSVSQDNMHLPTYNFRFEDVNITTTNLDRKKNSVWADNGKLKVQTGSVGAVSDIKTVAYEEDNANNYYTKTQINAGLLGNYPATAATASRVLVTDGNGKAEVSSINTTKLSYLSDTDTNIGAALASKEGKLTAGNTAQYYRGDKSWQTLDTTAVPEGTNLYWTQVRFNNAMSAVKNQVDGWVALENVGGVAKIPTAYLPGYVDDVVELISFSATNPASPVSGNKYYNTSSKKIFTYTTSWDLGVTPESDKIYTNIADNKTYRWSGSDMVALGAGIVIGSGTPEAVGETASAGNGITAAPFNHVHNLGSKVVKTSNIADGAVTATQIATNAVTTTKILNANVTEAKIADGAVTTDKIGNNVVTNMKLYPAPPFTIKANTSSNNVYPGDYNHIDLGSMVISDNVNNISSGSPSSLAVISRYTNVAALSPTGTTGSRIYTFPTAITLSANRKMGGRYTCQVLAHFLSGTEMIPVEVDHKISSAGALTITWNETIAPCVGEIAANSVVITVIQ